MTSPPLDYRKEVADRLTRASNTFPAHIDRDGVGWIKVRQDDVFAILGEREALLADNARMVKALTEISRGYNTSIWAQETARQALSGANHAD